MLSRDSPQPFSRINITITNNKSAHVEECNNGFAQLNLVDLVGCKSNSANLFKREDFYVNASLVILNLVIIQVNSLSDMQRSVNYRESKVVHCLNLALGGNSKTTVVCTILLVATTMTLMMLWFSAKVARVCNALKDV